MLLETYKRRPPFMTLFSEPGQGKTTLACMFPNAILLRVEDGVEAVPDKFRPGLMPVVETVDQLVNQIQWIWKERKNHGFKTVILDSATRLETMIEKEIVENDPNKPLSINQACGGFGAGVKAVGAVHARIRKLLGHLNQNGDFAVIVIAHSEVETIEPPDSDNYMRHSMRLGKKSQAPWIDDVDMVGFIQLQKYVKGAKQETKNTQGKAGKAMSDGTRELVAYPTPANVSKNRFGLPDGEPIELPDPRREGAVNPLFAYIPYYRENGYCDAAKDVTDKVEKVVDQSDELAQDTDSQQVGDQDAGFFEDDEPNI